MSKTVIANENVSFDDVDFVWIDGYWQQNYGPNILKFKSKEAASWVCDIMNQNRNREEYRWGILTRMTGYGIKNKDGMIVYERAKVKKQRFYYDEHKSNFGNGHYPFIDSTTRFQSFIDYLFVLDKGGFWVQSDERYIDGIDGKMEALAALNDGQDKGIGIKNYSNVVLCSA